MNQIQELRALMIEYFEQQTDLSWSWQPSLEWIAPILVSTILAGVAAFVAIRNTNMQIRNQTKDNNRPYIKIVSFVKKSDFPDAYYEIVNTEGQKVGDISLEGELTIKNIGVGVACNIKIIGIDEKTKVNSLVSAFAQTKHYYYTLDLEPDGDKKIKLDIDLDKKDKIWIPRYFSLVYTDLNGNIYITLVKIHNKSLSIEIECYQSKTKVFKKEIMKTSVRKREIIKKYYRAKNSVLEMGKDDQ